MANIKKTEEMLTMAIFEVFEKMFYLFVEPLRDGDGDYELTSAVSFNGPIEGTVQISLSRGIAETMVQNMLNLEKDEITEPLMADCVKESINMICGNFVRKLDPEKVFHLSIPTFERLKAGSHGGESKESDVSLTFTADGGYIHVAMRAPGLL
jgi:CheY-specific phosphatase CheX